MCYNFSEEETNTIFKALFIIENLANQFAKKNNTNYNNNNNLPNMGKIITVNIDNELSIDNQLPIDSELNTYDELDSDDELNIQIIKNMAILPPSPSPSSNWISTERKYETLITDPWDTNRNICRKAMKGETKYVSHAIYEKKLRNLKRARTVKCQKQKVAKGKKRENEKEIQLIGMTSKRRRRGTDKWDSSVPTKWSSINNDFILIDF
jgi:hypothetical protein